MPPHGVKVRFVQVKPRRAQVAAVHRPTLAQQLGHAVERGLVIVRVRPGANDLPLPPGMSPDHRAVEQRPLVAGVNVQRPTLPPQLDE